MPRALKAAPDDALMRSMSLFWREGCGPVGTRRIEEETGLTRFTLQTAYGGKQALFLKALDAYLDLFEKAEAAPPGKDASLDDIAAWFEWRASSGDLFPTERAAGCLMLNAMSEFGGMNAEVNARSDRYFGVLRARFAGALRGLVQCGELPPDFDTDAHVGLLVSAAIGLNVEIRARRSNEQGAATAVAIGKVIRGWRRSG